VRDTRDIHLETSEITGRVRQIIEEVIATVRAHVGEEGFELYLFGSRARYPDSDYADIDLGVLCEQLSDQTYRKIRREIANLRTLYTIDLVDLQRVDPAFKELILSTARKVYG